MTINLSVSEAVRSANVFEAGKFRLAVDGLLVCSRDECWIIDSGPSSNGDSAKIRIADVDFLSRLIASVPTCEGGEFLYFDEASVCGSTSIDANGIALRNIWDVAIKRNGQSFSMPGRDV